jgi:glycerol-3-phosphate dehydrogenase subunit C
MQQPLGLQFSRFDNCTKCSLCVNQCPVSKVDWSFPGPKQLGPDWLRIEQGSGREIAPHTAVNYCSNCKLCENVCPSRIPLASINQWNKARLIQNGLHLRERILANPDRLGQFAHLWPQGINFFASSRPFRLLTEKTLGISADAPIPIYKTQTFKQLAYRSFKTIPFFDLSLSRAVVYYPGCYTQYNRPEIGIALLNLLGRLKIHVLLPDLKCCGQPAISNGHLHRAKENALENIAILTPYLEQSIPVIFSCPSCLLTFKEEYATLLDIRGADYSFLFLDVGEYLRDEAGLLNLLKQNEIRKHRFAYHEPCHLKATGLGTPSISIMHDVSTSDIIPLQAGCCGLSGSYGLKADKNWVTSAIGENVKRRIVETKADAVITECGMCATQIGHLSHAPVIHPLEILSELATSPSKNNSYKRECL